jgi:ABC-type transport system substrate-binding protein
VRREADTLGSSDVKRVARPTLDLATAHAYAATAAAVLEGVFMLARLVRVLTLSLMASVLAFSLAQTLVIARGTDALTLDVHRATDSPTATVLSHVFEPLLELTAEGEVVPRLATAWQVSPDGLTYTFTIRQGVTFHDGTPLTAEIVRGSLMRLWEPANAFAYRFLINAVTSMEAPDDTTFVMRLGQPFAPLLFHLTHIFTAIMNPAAIEAAGEDVVSRPVGTGPFRLGSWDRNNVLEVVRFDGYWGDRPALDAIQFRVVPEGTTRLALVESGEAHIATDVPPQDIARMDAHPQISVVTQPVVRTVYVYFNMLKEPFNDVRVRRAINYAVNKEEIVEFVMGNTARVSDSALPPRIFGYAPVENPYEYNPEMARQLLAEAGYPNGFSTTLFSPTSRYPQDIQTAEAIQSMLADVGITAEIETTSDFSAYIAITNEGPDTNRITMALLGWGVVTGDADYGLYPLLHSSQWRPTGNNRAFYRNAVVDDLLTQARTTGDQSLRAQLYADALQLIHDDAAWLFLHTISIPYAVRDNVDGVVFHFTERIIADGATIR